jgi:hypothetical protein
LKVDRSRKPPDCEHPRRYYETIKVSHFTPPLVFIAALLCFLIW